MKGILLSILGAIIVSTLVAGFHDTMLAVGLFMTFMLVFCILFLSFFDW